MRHPRKILVALLLVPALCSLPGSLRAQSLGEPQQRASQRPDFLEPPPRDLLRQGLQPLASELPDTAIREGLLPPDASRGLFGPAGPVTGHDRGAAWKPTHFHWCPSGIRYEPLYFEDAMLERHGQSRRPLVQPLASGARFFLTVPALPYAFMVDPPRRPASVLGHFRPGSGARRCRRTPVCWKRGWRWG
jgi:hypothetical protein